MVVGCTVGTAAAGDSHSAQWNSTATAAERLLDKPLSLTDRLRFEFGVDAVDDSESGWF